MPDLNIVICPGCGTQLPVDNRGCTDCGYENNEEGRLLTIAEIVARPSYPSGSAMRLNDVSPVFIEKCLAAAIAVEREACAVTCELERVDMDATQSDEDEAYNTALIRAATTIRARRT